MYTKNCLTRVVCLICLQGFLSLVIPASAAETSNETEQFRVGIRADAEGKPISPIMHGVFFEDINYAADGGLYAELVQNRSFEHRNPTHAWKTTSAGAAMDIGSDAPLHANNPAYCKVNVQQAGAGITNGGYDGFDLKANGKYLVSVHLRGASAGGKATFILRGAAGDQIARVELGELTSNWQQYDGEFVVDSEVTNARIEVVFDRAGEYHVDMVSLFPADTFRGRRNGLRKDLAQLLADLKPGFVRFPGGCIVEGQTLDNAYRWKDTVGPIWQRKQNDNLWANRESPQYQQTYGLGFYEFFQYCEDIDAEPVPIVNCGMACQARGGPAVPMDELGPWVQDALDLVEFATGPADSRWGRVRAEMGHPEPFDLKYLGVGNEQWMEGYFDRYLVFYAALKAQYPDLQIVSTSGPQANDPFYRYAWQRFDSDVPADVVDEHYYRSPQWFLSNSERYDRYDPRGPKVFAGEFAAHEANRESTQRAAVSEAAFMTGLWRNANVVTMTSYAPLFAREGNVQWAPDLIWFNNTKSYGTPSYHVQAMYGQNVPDVSLPTQVDASMLPPPEFRGRVGIGTWRTQAEFRNIRVTRGDQELYTSDGTLDDWDLFGGDWSAADGVIRQSSQAENVRAFVGEENWSDYTIELEARKTAGQEGFLVSFASQDPLVTSWWNLGGWNNTDHGLEAPTISLRRTPGKIETGQWYKIKIEVKPTAIVCYLDGDEVQRAELEPTPSVFAASGWDEETAEYVVAVANSGNTARQGSINIAGGNISGQAKLFTLAADSPLDVNSFESPEQVAPQEAAVQIHDGAVTHEFPAWSFTIIRAKGSR